MHLFANLVARARAAPDGVFCHILKDGAQTTLSNAAVVAAAGGIARRVRHAGVRPGQVVPIVLEHRSELYSSFIGCTLAGVLPALLPPLTPRQDPAVFASATAALMARIDAPCVIASGATRANVMAAGRPVIDVDVPADGVAELAEPVAAEGDLAFLQHSSGTTGLKKGVCLSHGAVLTQIGHYAAAIGLTPDDRVASWLPLYHDMGLITSFLMPAVCGIPIVSLDAQEWVLKPTLLLDAIEHHRASLCWLPNFAFLHIARLAEPERQWDLSSLRLVVNCSEPCRAKAFDVFAERFAASRLPADALQTSYAMAENVFAVTQTLPGRPVRRGRGAFLSSGPPLTGVEIRIVGEDPGEIVLRSDCLFGGYFRQPELTAARLRDGWYHTGDIGFLAGGELFVVGRLDDVLNLNGRKLIAHELEDALNGVAGIAPGRVLVYADFDEAAGAAQLVVAAELAGDGGDAGVAQAVRHAVMAQCGLRPHRVRLLARGFLIKSTSGKISRAASIAKLQNDGAP